MHADVNLSVEKAVVTHLHGYRHKRIYTKTYIYIQHNANVNPRTDTHSTTLPHIQNNTTCCYMMDLFTSSCQFIFIHILNLTDFFFVF